MKKSIITLASAALLMGYAGLASAETGGDGAAAPPTQAGFGDVLTASGISVRGVVDTSYNYLSTDGHFTSGTADRAFADSDPNSFSLNQVGLFISKSPTEGVGGMVNVTLGDDVNSFTFNGSDKRFDLTQAYLSYATGGLTVIAGKYVTLAGAEVIDASSDTNASRGILFGYAIPFSHTGVRATYKLNDAFTLIGGINNGWDTHLDGNDTKVGEFGLLLTPMQGFSLFTDVYVGDEATTATTSAGRYLVDVVATVTATDALSFTVNADYAKQKEATGNGTPDAEWGGVAAYANAKLTDSVSLSLRGEYFDDKDGFRTGVVQKWKEVTGTVNFKVAEGLSVLPEVRYDFSNESSFADGADSKKNQVGVMLKVLYTFGNG